MVPLGEGGGGRGGMVQLDNRQSSVSWNCPTIHDRPVIMLSHVYAPPGVLYYSKQYILKCYIFLPNNEKLVYIFWTRTRLFQIEEVDFRPQKIPFKSIISEPNKIQKTSKTFATTGAGHSRQHCDHKTVACCLVAMTL